jgi:hypothetical protein
VFRGKDTAEITQMSLHAIRGVLSAVCFPLCTLRCVLFAVGPSLCALGVAARSPRSVLHGLLLAVRFLAVCSRLHTLRCALFALCPSLCVLGVAECSPRSSPLFALSCALCALSCVLSAVCYPLCAFRCVLRMAHKEERSVERSNTAESKDRSASEMRQLPQQW